MIIQRKHFTQTAIAAGILFFSLSSCEQSTNTTEIETRDTEGNKVSEYKLVTESDSGKVAYRTNFQEEVNTVRIKLDSLQVKARKGTKKIGKKMDESISELNQEFTTFKDGLKDEEFKAKWEKFKDKVDAAADSLDKRM